MSFTWTLKLSKQTSSVNKLDFKAMYTVYKDITELK